MLLKHYVLKCNQYFHYAFWALFVNFKSDYVRFMIWLYLVATLSSCRFDHIILETTGLANPGPVAAVLWVDDQLESPVHLDSIVTVCF